MVEKSPTNRRIKSHPTSFSVKCENAAAAEGNSVTEEPVKEKKDGGKSIIITIITNSKLCHLTKN